MTNNALDSLEYARRFRQQMKIKWPTIISDKPDIQNQYIDHLTKHYLEGNLKIGMDRNLPTTTTLYGSANYAIWNGGSCVLQSAWNDYQIVKGAGWVNPFETIEQEKSNIMGYGNLDVSWDIYKTNQIKQNSKITKLKGNYAGFHTWHHNHYSHIIHDNLPYLLWFISVIPEDYKLLMLKSQVKLDMLKELDPKLLDRIIWLDIGETAKINGNLIVSTPDVHPCIMGYNLMPYFKRWINNCNISRNPKDVIFYTRKGTTCRRVLDSENEAEAISVIKRMMLEFDIQGDFKIFSGKDEDGKTLSLKEQIDFFKNAHTVIGPHGTGLINIIYSDLNNVNLLEFIPSLECGIVQRPFNGHFPSLHGLNFNFYHILFTDNSTAKTTYINIPDLKSALKLIWKKSTT